MKLPYQKVNKAHSKRGLVTLNFYYNAKIFFNEMVQLFIVVVLTFSFTVTSYHNSKVEFDCVRTNLFWTLFILESLNVCYG